MPNLKKKCSVYTQFKKLSPDQPIDLVLFYNHIHFRRDEGYLHICEPCAQTLGIFYVFYFIVLIFGPSNARNNVVIPIIDA